MTQVLGFDHAEALVTANNLASTLLAGGKRAEAVELFERVLCVRRSALGADHPSTLAVMHNLARARGE